MRSFPAAIAAQDGAQKHRLLMQVPRVRSELLAPLSAVRDGVFVCA